VSFDPGTCYAGKVTPQHPPRFVSNNSSVTSLKPLLIAAGPSMGSSFLSIWQPELASNKHFSVAKTLYQNIGFEKDSDQQRDESDHDITKNIPNAAKKYHKRLEFWAFL